MTFGADGNVHVAAELAFFHVSIAHAAVDEDLAEGGEVGKGFLGAVDVGLTDDLHQRGAGAIEVDGGEALVVGAFGHVFFQMDAGELHDLAGIGDAFLRILRIGQIIERNAAAEAERQIKLGDLVVLRHVGVEVVLPVPFHHRRRGAVQHDAGEDGLFNGQAIEDREGSRQAEAGGAGEGIGLCTVFSGTGAEHFTAGVELGVDFESDGNDVVWHGR